MQTDPLKSALSEISAKLDDEIRPVVTALLMGESVEESWETLLKEVLDAA